MKRIIVVVITIFALLAVTGLLNKGEADEIYGCYKKNNGQLRIVSDHDECRKYEGTVTLNSLTDTELVDENGNVISVLGLRLEIEGTVDGGIASAYSENYEQRGMFVGTLTGHRLGFVTNSAERVSISPDGNVGIGTTKPLQPLHVQGNTYVFGNLGVKVYNPDNDFQVSGTNALFQYYRAEDSFGTDDFRVFISKRDTDDIASLIFQDNYSGRAELGLTGDNDFHIKVSEDGEIFTDAVIVDHKSGNVGIGSTSWEPEGPPSKLFVLANSDAPAIMAENLGAGAGLIVGGYVGIGTGNPQGELDVNGSIYQRGSQLHADYVFESDYKLESIEEHAEYMWNNKHLKAIPKAKVDEEGREIVEFGSHQKGIVEELEKAHIYINQLHKHIKDQNSKIKLLEERLTKLETRD